MSKIYSNIFQIVFFLGVFAAFCGNLYGENEGSKDWITTGNQHFKDEQFTDARDAYENVYAEGVYTETMLYRLAFIHENLGNFPKAIYYLKKIRQEFGGQNLDEKIVQLFRKNGTSRYMARDFWNSYLLFFNHWGWLVWGIMILSVGWLSYYYFSGKQILPSFHKHITLGTAVAFGFSFLLLLHYLFFVPERGVIIHPTSFYNFPSFGADSQLFALSPGETIEILGEEDIWIEVEAGKNKYWVPRNVILSLGD